MTASSDFVARDMAGETVCGLRVAAWRETHPDGETVGHRYSEHWSTPNSRHPNVKVERLFTEDQVRSQFAAILELKADRDALVGTLRKIFAHRYGDWVKIALAALAKHGSDR